MPLTSVTRYPGGLTNAGVDEALADLKMLHPAFYGHYYNDFITYTAGDWTITGTGTAPAAVANADGGVLSMLSATAAVESMALTTKSLVASLTRDFYWFESLQQTVGDATASALFAGLSVAATDPITTPPTDGIFIRKAPASVQLVGVLRVASVDVATVNMGNWALNTPLELGIVYTAANGVLNVFMGTPGGNAAAYRLATSPAAFPATAMGPNLAIGPGASGAAQTLQIDYVGYGKSRQ